MKLSKLFLSFTIGVLLLITILYSKVAPPRGDEIHYLITAQSIINDHDLWLENNYDQRDYSVWYSGVLDRHSVKGKDGHEYLYHGLGAFPFLIIPGFILAERVGVSVILVLLSALLLILSYRFIIEEITNKQISLIIIGAAFFSLPLFQYSFLIFPEMVGGLLILLCILLLRRKKSPVFLTALLIGILPWIHLRFLPLGVFYGLVYFFSTKKKTALVSFIPILLYFVFLKSVYGSFNPLQPYITLGIPTNSGNLFVNLVNIFFDGQYGLFFHAPFYLFALPGLILWYRQNKRTVFLISLTIAIYFFTVFRYYDWNGGFSPPARYLVPILPLLLPAIGKFLVFNKNLFWRGIFVIMAVWAVVVTFLTVTFPQNWGFIYMDGFAPYLNRISNIFSIGISDLFPVYYPEKSLTLLHIFWTILFGIFELLAIHSIRYAKNERKNK